MYASVLLNLPNTKERQLNFAFPRIDVWEAIRETGDMSVAFDRCVLTVC